jgi:isoaspartyl peptidase/L-asparaginase-like protein (Ntn-hydrolase superfamily)
MSTVPIILTTWPFGLDAARMGWRCLSEGASALDAIEAAANVTERDPAVNSVGYGGLPNAEGVVELDAAIMDGPTHSAGAVGGMTGIKTPISVARLVMERTSHVMLVGENARRFALANGFANEELLTPETIRRWEQWKHDQAAADVTHFDLGPKERMTPDDHDTIGLCALDRNGQLAVGCTTSGMAWKVPGRVGDSPILGSGLYVDNEVGGAAATGHGDEIMKACLSYRVVMLMEQGRTPQEACEEAIRYLLRKRPPERHDCYGAALIALRKDGLYGAAASASGFRQPDRLWSWVHASSSEAVLHEGPYVTLETVSTSAPLVDRLG